MLTKTLRRTLPPGPATPEALRALQEDLDALRRRTMRRIGARDARYVITLLWLARALETSGRGLVLMGGWFWPTWLLGTVLLTLGHLVETMELGHNLMHGQFDWMNDPRFEAHGYRWNFACEPADWREFHNLTHHHYSNVLGRDRDYGSLRLTADRPWTRWHLLQGGVSTIAALSFEWGIAIHNLQLDRRKIDPQGSQARIARLWPRTRARLLFTARREYLWWPLLGMVVGGGLGAWQAWGSGASALAVAASKGALLQGVAVLAGHMAAGVARNVWAYFIIACGHFTTEAHTFDEADLPHESKGQWYLRQILSAANIRGGVVLQVLSGHATHQIEHHIYPDLPSSRLAEIAPAVQAICERHGVPYNTGSLTRQVATVVLRIVRHSLPGGWLSVTRLGQAPSRVEPG